MGNRVTTGRALVPGVAAFVALSLVVGVWLSVVSKNVGEPYLVSHHDQLAGLSISWFVQDEIFHVGQAQTYCAGRLREWDPKITTPPGL